MGTICGKKIHFKTSLQKFVQKPHRKYLGGRKLESGFKSRAGYNGARTVCIYFSPKCPYMECQSSKHSKLEHVLVRRVCFHLDTF